MRTLTPDAALAITELQQMLYDLGHEIDANTGRAIADYYCADGAFVVGEHRYQGHAQLEAFYAAERDRIAKTLQDGERQLLHAFVNPRIFVHDESRATIKCFNLNFSAPGARPIAGPIAPNLLVECRLECRREADGHWRIAEFSSSPQFVAKTIVHHDVAKGDANG
ncbi:nuclear transport factor 2 family protein [Sphingomonas montanisoli]|uniref:SnoaL-like domain-containing protein n=1 Tax=Sphingomonas montanisoli TaxID=2606412 RepID=A0A5D9C3K1_9SPHN|nr:nuclear transport factor 2 family protein [Sphingomonas montanisoli]TZG25867.1 hypothetical protein FYJ91_12870 [Sphingomonas montanisoli]